MLCNIAIGKRDVTSFPVGRKYWDGYALLGPWSFSLSFDLERMCLNSFMATIDENGASVFLPACCSYDGTGLAPLLSRFLG
jgi:hypothetical protein